MLISHTETLVYFEKLLIFLWTFYLQNKNDFWWLTTDNTINVCLNSLNIHVWYLDRLEIELFDIMYVSVGGIRQFFLKTEFIFTNAITIPTDSSKSWKFLVKQVNKSLETPLHWNQNLADLLMFGDLCNFSDTYSELRLRISPKWSPPIIRWSIHFLLFCSWDIHSAPVYSML